MAAISIAGCAGNKAPVSTGSAGVAPADAGSKAADSTAMAPLAGAPAVKSPVAKVSDVQFAKTQFASLTEGEAASESALDWQNFRSANINVGEIYAKMNSEAEKAAFRKSFIESFSKSFKSSGASASDVSNWRVEKETPAQSTVIGTAKSGKTIALTLNKSGDQPKISSLEIR